MPAENNARDSEIIRLLKLFVLLAVFGIFACTSKSLKIEEKSEDAGEEIEMVEIIEDFGEGDIAKSTIDSAQAKVLSGKAYMQLEDYDDAIDSFIAAITVQPDLEDEIKPFLADCYRNSAEEKLNSGEYKLAVNHFQRMAEIDVLKLDDVLPDVVKAYKNYAKEQQKDGDVNEVFYMYENLINLSPENANLVMGAGDIAYSSGRYTKAIEFFKEAGQIDPLIKAKTNQEIAKVLVSRGKVYLNKGSYTESIDDFNNAKNYNPKVENDVDELLTKAHLKLGDVFMEMKEYDSAEEQWNKCLELSPGSLTAYGRLGLLYMERGMDQKALDIYSLMNEIDPENIEVLGKIADLNLKMKQFEKAQDALKKVLNFDADHLYSRFNKNLAEIYFYEKNYDSAIKYYLDYLGFYPGDAEAAFQLARAYSFTKEYLLAKEYYTQAVSIDRKWKNEGGFYWGFRMYQARVWLILSAVLLLAGLAGGFFHFVSGRKK